jgi:P22 coat protein - gene protein 5
MAGAYLTDRVFARETLICLGGELRAMANMSKAYQSDIDKKRDRKIGDTIQVPKPPRFIVAEQVGYAPQPYVETSTPLVLDQFGQIAFDVDSIDATLRTDIMNGGRLETIRNNYARPLALAMASSFNARAAKFMALNTWNMVGTPGTTPTTIDTYLSAGDKIVQQGLPANTDLVCIHTRKMSSSLITGSKLLFNDQSTLGKQFKDGRAANQLGYVMEQDETLYTHTTGAMGGTPLVSGANQSQDAGNNGTGTLTVTGFTANTKVALAGDVFTAAGCYSVHPQTRQSTGELQQFVLTADVTAANDTTATLQFRPAITPVTAGSQFANVTASPTDGGAVLFWGVADTSLAGKVSKQGLLLSPMAFAFASVKLDNPKDSGVEVAVQETDPETGLSISYVRAWDNVGRGHINRWDAMCGFARLYPELACRIAA